MVGNDTAFAKNIVIEIDGNDDAGAKGAAYRNGNWIDKSAIHQPASLYTYRLEYARQGIGGVHCSNQRPLVEPDFMTGLELCGDAGKFGLKILNAHIFQMFVKNTAQPVSGDDAATA